MLFSSHRLAGPSTVSQRWSRRRGRTSIVAVAVASLVFSACGSDEDAVSSDDRVEIDANESGSADADPPDAAVVQTTSPRDAAESATDAGLRQFGTITVGGRPLVPYDSTIEDLAVGESAPVVRGVDFDGTEIVVGEPTENSTLLVFVAHWCPHCNDEIPVLLGLEADGRLPAGMDVVGVSTAAAPDRDNYPPSQWIADKGWVWPTMVDDEAFSAINAFGGTAFPFAVVLDTDGTVLARRSGGASADDTVAFLDDALAVASG